MVRFTLPIFAVAILIGRIGTAQAADAGTPQRTAERRFAELDANKDGKLSLEEYSSGRSGKKEKVAKEFRRLDQNSDLYLNSKEFKLGND